MLSFKGEEPKAITHSCPMAQAMLGSSEDTVEEAPATSKKSSGEGHASSAIAATSTADYARPKGQELN